MNINDDDSSHALSEDTLLQLQNNDSSITAVDVLFGQGRGWHPLRRSQSFDAFDIDWSILTGNTHLNALRIGLGRVESSDQSSMDNLEAFYTECAHIRSIESLGIWDTCSPFRRMESPFPSSLPLFKTLLPTLFVHNNLIDLTLSWCGVEIDTVSAELLAKSLLSGTKLEKFDLSCQLGDMFSAEMIVSALEVHDNLRELHLYFGWRHKGTSWYAALGRLLQKSTSKLENLNIAHNNINDDGAIVIGNALLLNNESKLKHLDISHNEKISDKGAHALGTALFNNTTIMTLRLDDFSNISFRGWVALSRGLINPNSSLVKLNLRGVEIGDRGLAAFGYAIANVQSLRELSLDNISSASASGWDSFFKQLTESRCVLEILDLSQCTNINDEVATSFVSALSNMPSLKTLYLNYTRFTTIGWVAISRLLRSTNCCLEKLILSSLTTIGKEAVMSFASALSNRNNTTLKTLLLCDVTAEDEENGYANMKDYFSAFADVLCNKASIDAIYFSNHTLQEIDFDFTGHASRYGIVEQGNENTNKAQVARHKILKYHTNIQTFLDMKLQELPYSISWMGRDNFGLPLLFKLCLSMPWLFDPDSIATILADSKTK